MTAPDPLAIAAQIEQDQPVVAAMLRRLARVEMALGTCVGDLELLRMAISVGDPKSELLFRVRDMQGYVCSAYARLDEEQEK